MTAARSQEHDIAAGTTYDPQLADSSGLLAKAERSELALTLPAGLIRDSPGVVVRDPNLEVQERLCLLFETFLKVRSVTRVTYRDGRAL